MIGFVVLFSLFLSVSPFNIFFTFPNICSFQAFLLHCFSLRFNCPFALYLFFGLPSSPSVYLATFTLTILFSSPNITTISFSFTSVISSKNTLPAVISVALPFPLFPQIKTFRPVRGHHHQSLSGSISFYASISSNLSSAYGVSPSPVSYTCYNFR